MLALEIRKLFCPPARRRAPRANLFRSPAFRCRAGWRRTDREKPGGDRDQTGKYPSCRRVDNFWRRLGFHRRDTVKIVAGGVHLILHPTGCRRGVILRVVGIDADNGDIFWLVIPASCASPARI